MIQADNQPIIPLVELPSTRQEVDQLLKKIELLGHKLIDRPTSLEMPKDYSILSTPEIVKNYVSSKDEKMIKLITYNVASLNAALKKGLKEYLNYENADFVCLQETKINERPLNLFPEYNYQYWWPCQSKKGYSGTAILSKYPPIHSQYGFNKNGLDLEGRVITLEFEPFFLVTCYVPNAGEKLKNLDKRMKFDELMKEHLLTLEQKGKSVIYTGDLNVAHQVIDLANPKTNLQSAGFSIQERESFTQQLNEKNYPRIDVDRYFYPNERCRYTFYGYRSGARSKGNGWRLDYFIVSANFIPNVLASDVRFDCYGASDHLPVVMWFKVKNMKVELINKETSKEDNNENLGNLQANEEKPKYDKSKQCSIFSFVTKK
ncbi:hypothetical protein K502DRAFT_315811 [Neoconidiobolus thromboides FSU 785]|nr:hypothetical protein K502DRAFT_315811 [Neoconidiobolus thromboides FSU 785]